MAVYSASIKNTPHARHFGTARQFAQKATKTNDVKTLALAVRELSDGLMGLALQVTILQQMVEDVQKKK